MCIEDGYLALNGGSLAITLPAEGSPEPEVAPSKLVRHFIYQANCNCSDIFSELPPALPHLTQDPPG